MFTFGSLSVTDPRTTKPVVGVPAKVTDATTGDPVQTFDMAGNPRPVVTGSRGQVGQFKADAPVITVDVGGGDPSMLTALELLGNVAEVHALTTTGRLSEASLKDTFAPQGSMEALLGAAFGEGAVVTSEVHNLFPWPKPTSAATFTTNAAATSFGTAGDEYVRLTVTSDRSNGRQNLAKAVLVATPGQALTLTGEYRTTDPAVTSCRMFVIAYDGAGGVLTATYSDVLAPTATWQSVTFTYATPPDAATVEVNVSFDAATTAGQSVDFRRLGALTAPGPWFDGDTPGAELVTHSWTGAPNASPSKRTTYTAGEPLSGQSIRARLDTLEEQVGPVQAPGRVLTNPIPAFDLPVVIRQVATGYTADIDIEALHSRGTGPTVYVDPTNGSSAGDGLTPATAVLTVTQALGKDPAEIILRGGIYTRAQAGTLPGSRRDLIVRSYPGERAILTQGDTTTWTQHAGNTYVSAALSAQGVVIDRTNRTAAGLPLVPRIVGSIAEVEATPGTAYYDSATSRTYVHLADGRAPGTSVLVSRSTYPLNTSTSGDGTGGRYALLFDGVTFLGGQTNRLYDGSGQAGSTLLAKDTDYMWTNDNGLSCAGFTRTVHVDSRAWNNAVDGFNYHGLAGVDGDALEIDCSGRLNGRGNTSQNGSTTHEAWRVVRVGGVYEYNGGPNVADVNDTLSANYGVRAGNAWADGEQVDFTVGSRLWLVGCHSTSPTAVRPGTGRVEVADFTHTGTAGAELLPMS